MAKTMKAILRKKSWTGREVGYALLLSLADDIKNRGNPNRKPLLPQSDFNRMVASLDDEMQYTQFKVMESIYSSILSSFNYKESMKQQFFNGYYRYFLSIQEVERAEDFYRTIEKFPLILTRTQYNELAGKSNARKRAFNESYYSLFFHTVSFFIDAADHGEADAIPESIMAAITETKSQPVTNKRILTNWAEDLGEGYYQLRDGRRSDSMSREDWEAALKLEFMNRHSYFINGELQDYQTTAKHYREESLLKAYEFLFKGEDAIKAAYMEKTGQELPERCLGDLEQALDEVLDGTGAGEGLESEYLNAAVFDDDTAQWHYYAKPPEDYSKYDALAEMLDRYRGSYSSRLLDNGAEYADEIPKREQFREFKSDYPVLSEAVKSYLEQSVNPVKGLKANQYYSPFITWGDLADMGFLDFQELTAVDDADIAEQITLNEEENTENFSKRERGIHHGIAVLEKASFSESGENGEYLDPVADQQKAKLGELHSIDYLETNIEEAESIAANLNVLTVPALRYIYAYNTFIDVVAAAYDIEFMNVAKCDCSYFESQIEAFNNLLYLLYREVYGTKADKKRKRAFIKKYFRPIEIETLKPTEEAVNSLRAKIEGLGYTKEAAILLKKSRGFIAELERKGEAEL